VAVAFGGLWYHLSAMPDLAHWLQYLKMAILAWATDRALRLARILYRNVGRNITKATVEALPGDASRVTIRMTRPWNLKPGQHLYLYMPTLALWTSHPFTITWSEDEQHIKLDDEKLPMNRQDIMQQTDRTMSLIIRRRTGFTNALFKKAYDSPGKTFTTTVLAEGPYGKIDTLGSYGTVVLVAGGVGITHPVPYVRELVEGYANGTIATRRVTLIWVIQTPGKLLSFFFCPHHKLTLFTEHLEWIRPWMTKILAMERRRDILKILLFVTRPSATVQMFPGRRK
jgi:hypothetical protein